MRSLNLFSLAATIVLGMPLASADELMERAQATFKPIPSIVPASAPRSRHQNFRFFG